MQGLIMTSIIAESRQGEAEFQPLASARRQRPLLVSSRITTLSHTHTHYNVTNSNSLFSRALLVDVFESNFFFVEFDLKALAELGKHSRLSISCFGGIRRPRAPSLTLSIQPQSPWTSVRRRS